MQTLESYLTEDIHRDRADIAAVEAVLQETAATIRDTCFGTYWPYEARRGQPLADKGLSQSTSAMMIHAIDLLLGTSHAEAVRPRFPFKIESGSLKRDLEKNGADARAGLSAAISPEAAKPSQADRGGRTAPKPEWRTHSRTYGSNDPLTLSFLADTYPLRNGTAPDALQNFIIGRATALLDMDPGQEAGSFFEFGTRALKDGRQPLSNAFVPLRIVRASKAMGLDPKVHTTYRRYFESTLHDQLSFNSIPDSRFDPAELMFCLEGILLTAEQPVERALFDRILDVLKAAQSTSTHWRATKPFLRDERGMVLFPVSVEAANSLLKSCQILDEWPQFEESTQKYIELLRLFWEWLRTRRMSFACTHPRGAINVAGWHSEHINDPDSIQLWDTAQVVTFLLGFRRRLHLHVAATTLRLSRFDVRRITKPKLPWSENTRDRQGFGGKDEKKGPVHAPPGRKSGYQAAGTIREQFEPVIVLGGPLRTYERIERDFIDGWLEGKPDNYSMLLYGPPGTGKTTVAENIADALKFRLITITVSDFLAEGGGDVEARAKMIFDVLEAQSDCVVLFDEIDELVLDRSSERHRSQDTVFKFMTPGMLTKLNNLRRRRRVIFIMATNYAYRIDPAIRRTGRIDENYLLLPPDEAARMRMLGDLLEDFAKDEDRLPQGAALHPGTVSADELKELASHAFFLGYKDIDAAIGRVLRSNGARGGPNGASVARLQAELANWGRTTTLRFYQAGFDEGADMDAVDDEFLPLILLVEKEGETLAKKHPPLSPSTFIKEMRSAAKVKKRQPRYSSIIGLSKAAKDWEKRLEKGVRDV